jgi:hypothetical protein
MENMHYFIGILAILLVVDCSSEDKPTSPIPQPKEEVCLTDAPSHCTVDYKDSNLCHKACNNYCRCVDDTWLCTDDSCSSSEEDGGDSG